MLIIYTFFKIVNKSTLILQSQKRNNSLVFITIKLIQFFNYHQI